jgi:hypothetical protein
MAVVDASECGNAVNGYCFLQPLNSNFDQFKRVVLNLTSELEEARKLAITSKNASAAVSATMAKTCRQHFRRKLRRSRLDKARAA